MTRAELEAIVAWWVPRLGLAAWEIEVEWDPRRDDMDFDSGVRHAATWRSRDYDEARLYFHPSEHADWDRRKANQLAVHELLHLVTRDVEFVLDQVDGQLHRDVDSVVSGGHRHAVEGAVDRLAYRLVDLVAELAELPPTSQWDSDG